MMRPLRVLAGSAVVAIAVAVGAAPALAQVPPPPEIPPLPHIPVPEQALPAFELIAPTVYPQCGTASLVAFEAATTGDGAGEAINDGLLTPAGLPTLPPEITAYPAGAAVFNVTSELFVICGAVPRPPQQYTCLVDLQAQQVINTVTLQVGVPLPLGLHPEGDVVEQTIVVEDNLPPPTNGVGAGKLAADFLVCSVGAQASPPQNDYSQPPQLPPPSVPAYTPPPFTPGSNPGYLAAPPAQIPPAVAGPGATGTNALGEAVTYAVVWMLPLGLLVFGGYFGGALTREISPSPPA